MRESRIGPLFQGSELPKLLLLVAISVVGWAVLWRYVHRVDPDPPPPELVVSGVPAPVEPDRSPEFETVIDKAPIVFRETAAYDALLTRARETDTAELARTARRDIFFTHLWNDPAHYRGVPVHLQGTARAILRYESKLSRNGWLYEAWIMTREQLGPLNPIVCVFEDAPDGLPIGYNVQENVAFDGYFFKLMRYEAQDKPRAAPLLVGRLNWLKRPAAMPESDTTYYWFAGGLAVMFVVSLGRWIWQIRRWSSPRSAPSTSRVERPSEHIEPDQLSAFLQRLPDEDDEPSPDPNPPTLPSP